MLPFVAVLALVSTVLLAALWRRHLALRREAFIRNAVLPRGLFDKLVAKYPHLTPKDCQLVANGLRQFFLAYLKSGRRFVAMPSEVVDALWHEFILHTRNYDHFCRRAFGRFLHHTPAVAMGTDRQRNQGLRRCWWQACREENVNPRNPTRLPLLFALDAKLDIPGGFRYVPDCQGVKRQGDGAGSAYCGGDFAHAGIDGSTDGFGDGAGKGGSGPDGSSDDGGCGGGCGGD